MPNKKILKTLNEKNSSSLYLKYRLHIVDILPRYVSQDILYMHFIGLSQVNMGNDWGFNRINQTRRIYCEPNISFCLNVTYIITPFDPLYRHALKTSFTNALNITYIITPFDPLYRHTLKTSFTNALNIFTKHGMRTLCH